jgi:hypothetical protein
MGVLIVGLALFSILFVQATSTKPGSFSLAKKLFNDHIQPPLSPPYYLGWLMLDRGGAGQYLQGSVDATRMSPNEYFQGVLVWSATPAFPLILALLLCGLLLIVLWLVPSIYSEKNPPSRSDNKSSKRMGEWLSRGLDASKIRTMLMWSAAFAVPSVLVIWTELQGIDWVKRISDDIAQVLPLLNQTTANILLQLGGVAGSIAILASLAKSGSSFLGIILDVDNYLRASPKDETPRARIIERYVSLLHYLAEYKDPAGEGYDRVVLVAHSLGALISADLLRFLKVQEDSPKLDVRLFTMGNPLRQLLNRYFPYLYQWVHQLPDNSMAPLKNTSSTKPGIGIHDLPDPEDLGVAQWVNAYRSGDYVGRSLWVDEWYDREVPARNDPDKPGPVYVAAENPPGRREEMCIGAGAHQHYWDQSAPDIAEKLDKLIG